MILRVLIKDNTKRYEKVKIDRKSIENMHINSKTYMRINGNADRSVWENI